MRRALGILLASGALAAAFASPAQAAFGLNSMDFTLTEADGTPAMQAGSHPDALNTKFFLDTEPNAELDNPMPQGSLKDLAVFAAPGLIGNPTAVPDKGVANMSANLQADVSSLLKGKR
jgi:hypothetical protein